MGGSKVMDKRIESDCMIYFQYNYFLLQQPKPSGSKPGASITQFLIKQPTQPAGDKARQNFDATGLKPFIRMMQYIWLHGCMIIC